MKQTKKQVLKPWRPIEAIEYGARDTVKVWGREYTADGSCLMTSLLSQGEEILAAPMRLVVVENGEEVIWEHQSNHMVTADDAEAVICGIQKSGSFVFNTTMRVEYDGLVSVTLKVVPAGFTSDEIFGYTEKKKTGFELNKLWVEIPLKREYAKMYQVSGATAVNFESDDVTADDVVRSSGRLATTMSSSFSPLITLTEGDLGLSYFCESAEYWQPESQDKAIELVVEEDVVTLRLHLLDSHPVSWVPRGNAPTQNCYFPLTYQFGFNVTPIKPYPENPHRRKILHLDGYVKEMPFDEYLATPSEEFGGKNGYDRMKELGVTTVIVHEAWNTTQNFWEIPMHRQQVVKNIIKECHARDIEFVPYFGYEISTIGSYWDKETVNEIVRVPEDDEGWFGWYREPFQRDYIVCYRSKWRDEMIAGVQRLADEYNIDGVYMDLGVSPCQNEKHGCGFRDHEGKLHYTYPIYGIRELMRSLYSIFEPRGGMINSHQGSTYNFPCRSFIHETFTGEEIVWYIKDEGADKIPMDYFNFTLNGRNAGNPVNYVVIEYPNWNFKDSFTVTLLNAALPRPKTFEHLEIIAPVWKAIDTFPIEHATWHHYLDNDALIKCSEEDVKTSFYEYVDIRGKKSILAFITNPTRHEHENVSISFAGLGAMTAYDASVGKDVVADGNTISLSFNTFDSYILVLNEI